MAATTATGRKPRPRRRQAGGTLEVSDAQPNNGLKAAKTRRVLIGGPKGGVGKTTLARMLATCAAQDDMRVAIADLDPQLSLTKWYSRRPAEMSRIDLLDASMGDADDLMAFSGYDLIIIDTPPGVEQYPEAITTLLRKSDLTLIPCGPSRDEWEILVPWVNRVALITRSPPAFVITRYMQTTLSSQNTKLKLDQSSGRLCPIELPASEDIKNSSDYGLGVTEIKRARGSKEAQGIWAFVRHELGV
jgi:chromosome partitioning protein